ncbi:UDP-3-O-(3-hydroxymyristoyl)glucosamine N-acyltransferase [Lentisphaerota bacterium WC36G]|nr:UDP-3-O-(3-hydroxymyristoyl)glucosamine N-acyltransferase [Lentisphaerae bacterium WC36]
MSKKFSISDIAKELNCELKGNNNIEISGVGSLDEAKEGFISFLGNKKYEHLVEESIASAFIVPADYTKEPAEGKAFLLSDNVDLSFSMMIMMFAPPAIEYPSEIHSSAVVAETATIGKNVHIGPCAIIDEGVKIGNNSVITAGTYIGVNTVIGEDCLIYQNVTIRERCVVGNRCIIHSGTVIGADGYGFVPGPQGIIKIPQVGNVEIHDDVEIGSNVCVDRARFGKTIIKTGVKIDNLVQVAHNVEIGEFSLLIGQSGVAGSAKIGRGCIIAGRAGVNGHIKVGDGTKVAGTSNLVKGCPPNSIMVGTPAEPQREFMTRLTLPKKVKKMQQQIKDLQKQLNDLSN